MQSVTADDQGRTGTVAEEGLNLIVVRTPESPAAGAYRSVRATIRNAQADSPIRSLLIAESGVGDQSGVAGANIAASFAMNGDRTVIIDADCYSPNLHQLVGTSPSPGLLDWLGSRGSDQRPTPLETPIEGLRLLPAGSMQALRGRSPADMLTTDGCRELITSLEADARFVVFHAPQLPVSSEALTIASLADAVLLVIRSGVTKRTDAQRAREALSRVGAKVLGAILTDAG
jgi:Mrp family chromosome partitioning ATPase